MFEELLSGYLSPYLCLQNLFQVRVLHNFWTCCMFWSAYDMSMQYAEQHCGPESVSNMNHSFEMAFPGIRDECPGFGSMTCAQWFAIPIFFIVVGGLTVLLFVAWSVYVTYKYYKLARNQVVYCFDETQTRKHQAKRNSKKKNLGTVELDPSMLKPSKV